MGGFSFPLMFENKYSKMLQPETSLQYAIGWQTITYEFRRLKPYNLPFINY